MSTPGPQMQSPRIVLASASPRRRALLTEARVAFDVDAADVDETVDAHVTPERAACELAERKARVVAARHPARVVIGADTIVAIGFDERAAVADVSGRMLGKPADEREARAMLQALSGTRHCVVTGVCALSLGSVARTGFERTWVTMRRIEPAEIEAYVASQEWRDKAGGYAIQENADRFVTRVEEGGFDNVVGLPVALTLRLVALATADLAAARARS